MPKDKIDNTTEVEENKTVPVYADEYNGHGGSYILDPATNSRTRVEATIPAEKLTTDQFKEIAGTNKVVLKNKELPGALVNREVGIEKNLNKRGA